MRRILITLSSSVSRWFRKNVVLLTILQLLCLATNEASAQGLSGEEIGFICGGLQSWSADGENASISYRDGQMSVSDADDSLQVTKGGVLIAKIERFEFDDYVECADRLGRIGRDSGQLPPPQIDFEFSEGMDVRFRNRGGRLFNVQIDGLGLTFVDVDPNGCDGGARQGWFVHEVSGFGWNENNQEQPAYFQLTTWHNNLKYMKGRVARMYSTGVECADINTHIILRIRFDGENGSSFERYFRIAVYPDTEPQSFHVSNGGKTDFDEWTKAYNYEQNQSFGADFSEFTIHNMFLSVHGFRSCVTGTTESC